MSRYTSAFVRGVFVGFAAASLLLVASSLVYRGISLSLEGLYGGEPDSLALAEGRSLLLFYESQAGFTEALEDVDSLKSVEREPVDVMASGREEQSLYQQPKKPLLIVVVSSGALLNRTSVRIKRTWGRDTSEYRIIVGSRDSRMANITNVLTTPYPDFPAFPYLTIGDLNFLLNLVRSHFLGRYNWFLFAPSNAYVSVRSLERFLGGLNPNKVVYMGHPSNQSMPRDLHFCEGGTGIVLSHMALAKMKGQIEPCVRGSKRDYGYRELGKCLIDQLRTDCSMGHDVSCVITIIRSKSHPLSQ